MRSIDVAELVLENGASTKTRDESGSTGLHLAAWEGHMDVVSLILEKGGFN